ncbi:S8 family serine peptidase [Nocardioides zeae]|uniref:S8 family serine peptidase n=1 Tax=Nocardioides imazamoxiresistens TaxID=3231893 RepID=A0ABU3PW64_9ACTN|nr:S8 family serine peptidase [Nocardioides zeae]MDT9593449.1 S8 family serine peptidase [Nocardioides zeae]
MRSRTLGALAGALAVAATAVVPVGAHASGTAPQPALTAVPCPPDNQPDAEALDTPGASPLATELDFTTLHADYPAATDVGVAVLGTGVVPSARLAVEGSGTFGSPAPTAQVESLHGTQVAGIVAGTAADGEPAPGVAPGARIFSVQVADVRTGEAPEGGGGPQLVEPTAQSVEAGLAWVAQNAANLGIRVATVSVGVADAGDGALETQVAALADQGVLVVAAQGEAVPPEEPYGPGNPPPDISTDEPPSFPAGFEQPHVLAVGALPRLGSDAAGTNVPSYRTDVVAPSGAITFDGLGGTCEVDGSSGYAAAVVSGVAALMFASNPGWTPAQVRTRIIETAGGVTDAPNAYSGAGSVQPVEALSRVLDVQPDGTLVESSGVPRESVQAQAPRLPEDPLDRSRTEFLWWGLLAGAGVVLALVLRPALRRAGRGTR